MTLPLDVPGAPPDQTPYPVVRFRAFGDPVPQGSARGFVVNGRAVITSDNKQLRPWRALVADAARQAMPGPISGPVSVRAIFVLARPKSRPKKDRHPDRRPDLDKLARGLLDSLTGPCFGDDAQVVHLFLDKVYVGDPHDRLHEPGVDVELWPVTS